MASDKKQESQWSMNTDATQPTEMIRYSQVLTHLAASHTHAPRFGTDNQVLTSVNGRLIWTYVGVECCNGATAPWRFWASSYTSGMNAPFMDNLITAQKQGKEFNTVTEIEII